MSNNEIIPNKSLFPFTVFAFGTGDGSKMKEPNIITAFKDSCTSEKEVIEGPDLLGFNVTPNAQKTANTIIEKLQKTDLQDDYIVNLTGSSRGGVTCIRIANLLKNKEIELQNLKKNSQITPENDQLLTKLSRLKLNILTLDPVAGMGAKKIIESRVIPDNVKNYVAILQLDEMRRDFKPQDMTRTIINDPTKTQVAWLPLYGNHSDLLKIKNKGMQSTGLITQTMLYSFLTEHGTTFDKIPEVPLSKDARKKKLAVQFPIEYHTKNHPGAKKELLTLLNQQHQERHSYAAYGKRSKLGDSSSFRAPRSINQHKEYYVTDSNFFVNQLERELFKVTYPRVFNYLFELNKQDPAFPSQSTREEVDTELETLSTEHPILFKRLVTFEKLKKTRLKDGTISIQLRQQPQGSSYLEPCQTLQQLYPDLLPETVTPETTTESRKILQLKAEIIGVTSYYDREKAFYLTFDKRSQSNRTQTIRDAICQIVSDSQEGKKIDRMLEVISEHAYFLQLADNKSNLLSLLNGILTRYNEPLDKPADDDLLTSILIAFIDASLTLLKNTIYLIGSIGFVGGFALSAVGTFIEDLGRRANDVIGNIGYNPFKLLASGVATLLEITGFAIKHHMGVKPVITLITDGIRQTRDETIVAIRTYKQKLNEIKPVETDDPDKKDVKTLQESLHL